MPTTAVKLLTAEEFAELPEPADGSKQELVRGEIVTMSRPKRRHGSVQSKIIILLGIFTTPKKLGRIYTESGVVTERDPDSVRGPDIFFYRAERLPELDGGYLEAPPDLVVEILSPGDRPGEMRAKVREYLDAGVPLIWVVDPKLKSVVVHAGLMKGTKLGESEIIDGGTVLPGFTCVVADFFAD